jgi:uncharacterized lipoprotein YmbA
VGAGLAALTLAACASGPATPDHFYRLEAAAPAAAAASPALAGVVEVDRLKVDTVTDQLPVLYREADGTAIERHAYHRWMSPPSLMVQNELITYLRAAGAGQRVVTPDVRIEPHYHVTGRIIRLERVLADGGASAVVELELGVSRDRGQLLLLETYRAEVPAGDDGVDASVEAFDRALTQVFERFVADLSGVGS